LFKTKRRASAYLRKIPKRQRASHLLLSMPELSLPVYMIGSPKHLLFLPWRKVVAYATEGVTIFQAMYEFRSDKPGIDKMRQLLGLADIDRSNIETVPRLMAFWREQAEGFAWLDKHPG